MSIKATSVCETSPDLVHVFQQQKLLLGSISIAHQRLPQQNQLNLMASSGTLSHAGDAARGCEYKSLPRPAAAFNVLSSRVCACDLPPLLPETPAPLQVSQGSLGRARCTLRGFSELCWLLGNLEYISRPRRGLPASKEAPPLCTIRVPPPAPRLGASSPHPRQELQPAAPTLTPSRRYFACRHGGHDPG